MYVKQNSFVYFYFPLSLLTFQALGDDHLILRGGGGVAGTFWK